MKNLCTFRGALKIALFILNSLLLIGYSIVNPLKEFDQIYFPFLYHIYPVENRLVLSEIMVNPVGVEPGNEWIEIFNRSPEGIDLYGYKVGDSETKKDLEGMYAFPQGAYIFPGNTIVIANQSILFKSQYGFKPDFELIDTDPAIADLAKYRNWSGGVINLSNSGDEVTILNHEDELVDAVSWGDSIFAFNPPAPKTEDGMSLERKPANVDTNNPDDWSISASPDPGNVNLEIYTPIPITPTPTSTPQDCIDVPILITEVLYDPDISSEPDGEWVEIYNSGDQETNLDCLMIGDEETFGGTEGMMTFPQGYTIQPGQVIVIANQADSFLDNFGFYPDFEIRDSIDIVPNLINSPQWASGSISLSNSGDDLILMDLSGKRLDEVSWEDSTFAFQPPVPGVDPDHSISRQPADRDTDSADDWVDLAYPDPGIVTLDPPTISPEPDTATLTPKPPNPTATATPTVTSTITPTTTATSTSTLTPQPTYDLVINEVLADPDSVSGDANNDGEVDSSDDEFIELINDSSSPLDISSWSIGDVLDIRHTFPSGSILEPGCGLLLFGGGVPDGDFGNFLVQTASSGKLGLNDNMDIIYIYDTQLEIISSLSYGEEAGDNQSITRDPDILGSTPLRKHSLATGSGGTIFSPGTMINGYYFSGCID